MGIRNLNAGDGVALQHAGLPCQLLPDYMGSLLNFIRRESAMNDLRIGLAAVRAIRQPCQIPHHKVTLPWEENRPDLSSEQVGAE